MKDSKWILKQAALALITVSFILCTFLIIADVGISNTPYETTDSAGGRMGFNDPLSMEHFGIILSNFRIKEYLAPVYAYSWLLLIMHAVGAWLLFRCGGLGQRRLRWFFALQAVLFPIGWLGFIVLPWMVRSIFRGAFDRETMIDVPFITLTAQPIWIATAMAILILDWRASAQLAAAKGSREQSSTDCL